MEPISGERLKQSTSKYGYAPEIMAPVGSFDALAAAIRGGADSVYFGLGELNMRARASANFQINDLSRITRICRWCNVKTYLALNVIVYDSELDEVKSICAAAKSAGVDAIIAADPAVIMHANAIDMPVHISVQANIANSQALRFYARYADVIVPARELTLSQIKELIATIRREQICGPSGELLKIELFAHGALCMAVSGKCYLSLSVYNSSANRGGCFQNCRRRYRVIDEETGTELLLENHHIMSPKDICTIAFLDSLLDAGVDVLKIEGRGRSPDYVYTVTKIYREAVSAWHRGDYGDSQQIRKWRDGLASVFNRDFWEGGYYLGEPLGEWCGEEGNQASLRKVHLGRVSNYFSRIGVAELQLEAGELSVGQLVLITGPTTGAVQLKVDELRLKHCRVESAPRGSVVSVPSSVKVRKNDQLYLLVEKRFGDHYPQVL